MEHIESTLLKSTIRVQLARNTTAKKPKAEKIIVVDNYDTLVTLASAKLRLNAKKIRFFVSRDGVTAKQGLEISNDEQLQKILVDDIMLTASNGENYKGKISKGDTSISHDILQKISSPPRWPYPGISDVNHDSLSQKDTEISNASVDEEHEIHIYKSLPDSNNEKLMNGLFPIFKGNVLNIIRKTIERYPHITTTEKPGYISFDYAESMVFPIVKTWDDAVLRECRGLIVSSVTGKVLARRFHKFFNLNETDEQSIDSIDFTGAKVYEKLDGSLVSPILLDNGELIWATRKNRCYEVETFIKTSHIDYDFFARKYLEKNITPLFEWCHDARAVGVLCYSEKSLVLLAMRNNETGDYIELNEMYELPSIKIPIIEEHKFTGFSQLQDKILTSTNREGVVISLPSGQKYKLKCLWYIHMCNAQKNGGVHNFLSEFLKLNKTILNVPSEKIWMASLTYTDDNISACASLLPLNEAVQFRKFIAVVKKQLGILESQLAEWVKSNYASTLNKNALIAMLNASGWPDWIVTESLENRPMLDKLIHFILGLVKLKKIPIVENLLDIQWNSINGTVEMANDILDICTFHKCSDKLKNHVLNVYLPKKLANMLGMKQIFDDTVINLSKGYVADEGKIIGFWEQFTKEDVWDLRIDLQPSRKSGYTSHYGSPEYALFLVQYGLANNLDTHPHGEFAGVLVPTESNVIAKDIIDGLKLSFETLKMIKLRRRTDVVTDYKVFCDLDGVLADFDKGVVDVTGRSVNDQPTSKMWQRILNHPKFFETLDWTSNGHKFWDDILYIVGDKKPVILTGTPMSTKKQYAMEKKRWCSSHLGDDIEVITCTTAEKYKYSAPGHILIDDRLDTGKLWCAYGGTFIHHISPERSLYELRKAFKLIDKTSIDLDIDSTADLPIFTSDHHIQIISDVWPNITSDVISIDSEWDPDLSIKTISLVQLATKTDVYIIDMMAANDVVKERLNEILTDKSIVKLCFGLDVGEANRIGSDIYNVIDLQEIFMDNITTLSSNNTPSLSTLSTVILNKRLGKTKEIQAGNWSKRPLSSDQMEYAANDVTVLFDMYEYLKKFGVPSKNIYVPKISASRQAKSDFDPNLPVKVLYSAVFLSDTSKKELIKNIKPAHKNVLGDHVTLKYAPSEYYLRGTPVGDVVQIKITGEYTDDFVQAVRVECLNKEYHITLSVTPGTPPKISNDIGRWNDVPEFQLFGIVGVQICDVVDLLATLPDKIKRKILEFKNNAIMDESLKFKPGELSAAERSAIHEYASNNNITSTSTGKNDKRQLILTMRRKLKYDVEDDDKDGEHLKRITDMYQFSAMKIVNENDEILTKGYILDDDIKLSNEDLLLSEKILVILRGLPGSGKSKLAEILNHKFGGCVCSADKFFAMHNEYVFDKSKLDEAHNYCFTKVKSRMESSKHMIIVDNVNSRQNEYAKYISLAHIYNYKIVILEIYCKDRNEAVKFSLRSMHSVPTKDILKMIARWETDDNAVILSPYDFHKDTSETEILQKTYGNKESLHKWLSDMKMYHYNKLRRKTHICMEINSRPIVFLDVPEHLFSEFLERYVASGITDCIDDEPKYIMEVIGTKFKFFLDVDYIDDKKLSTDEIYTLVQKVQMVIKTEIFVTGNISDDYNCKIKTGMHFKFPSLIVDAKEAIELRDKIVSYLKMEMPDKNWDSIIDNTVYMGCRGLRMFGSRKTTKGVDKGKVYKLMLIVNEDGKIVEQTLSELDLLKKLCIVCK